LKDSDDELEIQENDKKELYISRNKKVNQN
jgi:hypothetical protein